MKSVGALERFNEPFLPRQLSKMNALQNALINQTVWLMWEFFVIDVMLFVFFCEEIEKLHFATCFEEIEEWKIFMEYNFK